MVVVLIEQKSWLQPATVDQSLSRHLCYIEMLSQLTLTQQTSEANMSDLFGGLQFSATTEFRRAIER